MAKVPLITLNNGNKMPQLGLGTYKSCDSSAVKALKHAIDIGYRHIDTAFIYQNEKEVGQVVREKIADGTVKRDELFITTKLWSTFHEFDRVVPALKKSLENLGLDYVDLYLIHWPFAMKYEEEIDFQRRLDVTNSLKHDFVETWKGMEKCVKLGLAKSIGVSNFNSKQIERILKAATIPPVTNQVEVNPHLTQKKLIKFCKDRNIIVTAYTPFGVLTRERRPGAPEFTFDDPIFRKIGQKYGKTSQQVILRYLLDIGTIPIPKSSNAERLKLNLEVFDFKLTDNEIAQIDSLNADFRTFPVEELENFYDFPFNEEF